MVAYPRGLAYGDMCPYTAVWTPQQQRDIDETQGLHGAPCAADRLGGVAIRGDGNESSSALPSGAMADEGEQSSAEAGYEAVVAQTDGLAALLNGTAADSTALSIDTTGDEHQVLSMGTVGSDALSVPADATDPIVMTRQDGSSVGVLLPGTPDNGKAVGGNRVLFEDVDKDTDALVQPQADAGVRVLTVIESSQAPTEFDYNLKLDDGHKLRAVEDGSVVVVDGDDVVVALIEAPWAFDAQGNAVGVSYAVSDNVLTLTVAHDDSTVYPVLADPVFTWGNISGTVYFDRQETRSMATTGIVPTVIFGLSGPWGWVLAGFTFEMTVWALAAYPLEETCLKVKYGWAWNWGRLSKFVEPGHYSYEAGIRCR